MGTGTESAGTTIEREFAFFNMPLRSRLQAGIKSTICQEMDVIPLVLIIRTKVLEGNFILFKEEKFYCLK